MSFLEVIEKYEHFDFDGFFEQVRPEDIERAIAADRIGPLDFLALLSPRATAFLESMACKSRRLTVKQFGRTIQLFIPLYISNFCTNECAYCGFNRTHTIERRKLTLAEIEQEAQAISRSGMRHLLLLTGEARPVTPMDYLQEAVGLLRRYFASVSIEMFPMDETEYRCLQMAGADGLTIYQEVYDRNIYKKVHLAGKKRDYRYRLDAPERGARAGFRAINIGALMGLGDMRREIFFSGMHARYLQDRFLDIEIGLSLPRINRAEGGFQPGFPVDDRSFVQFMTALRIFLPRSGLTVSTREKAAFRDHLIHLGATRFSAGSCTGVGGYAEADKRRTLQFEISDQRSVTDVVQAISAQGYQPIYKDWDRIS